MLPYYVQQRALTKPRLIVLILAAIVILLVGNKKDLEDEREVTFLEASRLVHFRK